MGDTIILLRHINSFFSIFGIYGFHYLRGSIDSSLEFQRINLPWLNITILCYSIGLSTQNSKTNVPIYYSLILCVRYALLKWINFQLFRKARDDITSFGFNCSGACYQNKNMFIHSILYKLYNYHNIWSSLE